MDEIRIVHLSDLHFADTTLRGERKNRDVWTEVRRWIKTEIDPHLVLVTGDLTDNASHDEFTLANNALHDLVGSGRIGLRYLVVPGNHDRYLYYGTGFGHWIRRFFLRNHAIARDWLEDRENRYLGKFAGTDCVARNGGALVHDVTLPPPGADSVLPDAKTWKLRIVGFDSCPSGQWFAQGAITDSAIVHGCRLAKEGTTADLVIALVHHHVLPVPGVESRAQSSSLGSLLNATGMLNSGKFLQALCDANVNLLLHGHEHEPHQAQYGGGVNLRNPLVVLGAGSATGERTGAGWNLGDCHFNVIGLSDDGSVSLRQVTFTLNSLSLGPRMLLLSGSDVRRARFLRGRYASTQGEETGPADPQERRSLPQSRLIKEIEFTAQHDIRFVEEHADWTSRDGLWKQTTTNSSGYPGAAIIRVSAPRARVHPARVFWSESAGDTRTLGLEIGYAGVPIRISSQWTWHGGAALTKRALEMLPAHARTSYRQNGREFAVVGIPEKLEYAAATLTVRIPPRYAPYPEEVLVSVERTEASGVIVETSVELTQALEFCGVGTIHLRIPYPMPGRDYVVSWPVSDSLTATEDNRRLAEVARANADDAQRVATDALVGHPCLEGADISLYLLEEEAPNFYLRRIAPTRLPATRILLNDAAGIFRIVWWGELAVVRRTDGQDGEHFVDGEQMVAVVPIRDAGDAGVEAAALIRVGIFKDFLEPPTHQSSARLTKALADMGRNVLNTLQHLAGDA